MANITIENLPSQSFINELEDNEFNSISGGIIKEPPPFICSAAGTVLNQFVAAPLRWLQPVICLK